IACFFVKVAVYYNNSPKVPLIRPVTNLKFLTVKIRFFSGNMAEKMEAQYGTWPSPINSSFMTANFNKFVERNFFVGVGVVYWSECRPCESGRTVVCSRFTGGKILQWTPVGFDVRSRVHEYGGGSFLVHNGVLYFSNCSDSRLYKQESFDARPVPLTEENDNFRYADACFSNVRELNKNYYFLNHFANFSGEKIGRFFFQNVPKEESFRQLNSPKSRLTPHTLELCYGFIFCIREDHTAKNVLPTNTVVSVNVSDGSQKVVVEGSDFYACPKISSDGLNLMWMQWSHPNMPWDDTEICIANLNENGSIQQGSERTIARKKDVNFMQPKFSPTGKPFFICDDTDWWNLYEYDESGNHHNVQPLLKELGGPQWVFSADAYAFDPKNSGDVAVAFDYELGIVNLKSELFYKQETGFTVHQYINFGRDGCIYCLASSSTKHPSIIRWNVANGETEVIKASCEPLDESLISVPEHIAFRTGSENEMAYGYFYAPKNPGYKGRQKTAPPLVVMVHGGPTAACSPTLDIRKQYLTSRGVAILDVNYRGSTGYGKKFRSSLYKNWGIYDVEDCCNGALHLAKEQKVDPNQLAIRGGSAGGYTVLACLTFTNVFKVGVSHYGIGDLETLLADTHKFESHYNDLLVGPYETMKDEFKKRSPINSVEKLNCPVAFFQGLDDKVVPPQQAQKMYEALLNKGIPTCLVLFPATKETQGDETRVYIWRARTHVDVRLCASCVDLGQHTFLHVDVRRRASMCASEGHGFRTAENIRLAVDGEFFFICKIFGIPTSTTPDDLLDVKNMDTKVICHQSNSQAC
uniref:Peptidase S9 prolyl oligopeptidase catalytic domain-containing protein n=1 Tax=Romanomermis culicivorax TaxID=13658 RepID=A0A915IKF2_ROMCU